MHWCSISVKSIGDGGMRHWTAVGMQFNLRVHKPLPDRNCSLFAQQDGRECSQLESRLSERSRRKRFFVGMNTKVKVLGLAAGLALFTGACASDDDKGAPPTVIIDRGQSSPVIIEKERSQPAPVVIERETDGRDVKVDVDVDKE